MRILPASNNPRTIKIVNSCCSGLQSWKANYPGSSAGVQYYNNGVFTPFISATPYTVDFFVKLNWPQIVQELALSVNGGVLNISIYELSLPSMLFKISGCALTNPSELFPQYRIYVENSLVEVSPSTLENKCHLEIVRTATEYFLYINGVAAYSKVATSNVPYEFTAIDVEHTFGVWPPSGNRITNFGPIRISAGARHSANFTPPEKITQDATTEAIFCPDSDLTKLVDCVALREAEIQSVPAFTLEAWS
jgi:hypothetical protein